MFERAPLNKFLLMTAAAMVLTLLLDAPSALAQCALCKTALDGAGAATARTMNLAILVLLVPPVTIFCSVFFVAFKLHKKQPEKD
ncbi:MAG: hypothetical protein M3R15_24735 [Acidobacteriota bacterium]|nr:hypothetical protein [Acidobacteriota bacterium]